ncbi:LysR substrate-binding domain-containing protein [Noviherbaspirillum saxi]|nr:LysR substrate-binding domain-containing protein [Noviherbaspirillum saxi]
MDLLRTLVIGITTGSFARAADRIGRSQSAVSLQMKKLEEQLDVEIFEKQGRALALTPAGKTLHDYALRMLELNAETVAAVRGSAIMGSVRFGMSVDFENTWLPATLARFARSHPHVAIEIRMDRNSVLAAQIERNEIDIALIFSNDRRADIKRVAELDMTWIGKPDTNWPSEEPLPLLLLESPCIFRQAAIKALDDAGIKWRIAVTSLSLGGLWAAAEAGLGLTVRSAVSIPHGLANIGPARALPALPRIGLCISQADKPTTPAISRLHEVITEVLAENLSLK